MKDETKFKVKAYIWDQIIHPIQSVFTSQGIKILSIVMMAISILIFKSHLWFLIFVAIALITSIYELIKYYRSGEFISNYRNAKYPAYRDAIRKIKKSKGLNSLTNLNNAGENDERQAETNDKKI